MKKTIMLIAMVAMFISTAAFANSTLDLNTCDESGLCTVFQVAISIDDTGARGSTTDNDVIYIGGSANPYISKVTWKDDTCSKQVRVPRDVYVSILSVMKSISGSNGSAAPALTPAQQTILLFYSTLMQQTLSFTCDQATVN
jgi:hypothetical protein